MSGEKDLAIPLGGSWDGPECFPASTSGGQAAQEQAIESGSWAHHAGEGVSPELVALVGRVDQVDVEEAEGVAGPEALPDVEDRVAVPLPEGVDDIHVGVPPLGQAADCGTFVGGDQHDRRGDGDVGPHVGDQGAQVRLERAGGDLAGAVVEVVDADLDDDEVGLDGGEQPQPCGHGEDAGGSTGMAAFPDADAGGLVAVVGHPPFEVDGAGHPCHLDSVGGGGEAGDLVAAAIGGPGRGGDQGRGASVDDDVELAGVADIEDIEPGAGEGEGRRLPRAVEREGAQPEAVVRQVLGG